MSNGSDPAPTGAAATSPGAPDRPSPGARAEARVWAGLPEGARSAIDGLSGSDLQTLLLALARTRSDRATPASVLSRWQADRFVRPASTDPRRLVQIEARLWSLLPPEVDGVALSPVAPLGTCSAVGPVSQNRIVSTTRLSEVLSDPTNALAVEAATRRRRQDSLGEVHLAAAHRVLRAQPFPPGFSSHFPLFALASSARDTGSGETESRLLLAQVSFWRSALMELLPAAGPRISVTFFDGGAVRERFLDTATRALEADGRPSLVLEDPDRQRARGYYRGAALRITAAEGQSEAELGDGGLTDWTAQLTGNAKERCCISCISIERLAELSGPT